MMPTLGPSLRQLKVLALPLAVFSSASLGLGFLPSPALVLVLLVLLLQPPSVDGFAPGGPSALLAAAAALVSGTTMAYFKDVHSALQSSSQTFFTLALLSSIHASVVIGITSMSGWIAAQPQLRPTPIARLLLFPIAWASAWSVLGIVSPLGRQAAWTPIEGLVFDSNKLLHRVLGPAAIDLTLALSASLVAESFARLAGSRDDVLLLSVDRHASPRSPSSPDLLHTFDPNDALRLGVSHSILGVDSGASSDGRSPLLPSIIGQHGQYQNAVAQAPNPDDYLSGDDGGESTVQGNKTSTRRSSSHSSQPDSAHIPLSIKSLVVVATLLYASLALQPSIYPAPSPSIAPLDTNTPLSIACVLPSNEASEGATALSRYLAESRRLVASAKVLLWPEGAVTLGSRSEWDAMVAEVGAVAAGGGTWIAVGAIASDDLGEGVGRKNALVLVGPAGEVVGEYHKQHRVPVAESFSIAKHPQVPPTFTLALPAPRHIAKSSWSTPELDYKRPVHLTSIICNDVNFPDLLASSRNSLTLVPSSTWSTSVGLSLLAQARARALETDAPLLMCDSGGNQGRSTGVSGFVDRDGHVLQYQIGGGSFVAHASLDVSPGFQVRRAGTAFQSLSEGGVAALLLLSWALMVVAERVCRLKRVGLAWTDRLGERLIGTAVGSRGARDVQTLV